MRVLFINGTVIEGGLGSKVYTYTWSWSPTPIDVWLALWLSGDGFESQTWTFHWFVKNPYWLFKTFSIKWKYICNKLKRNYAEPNTNETEMNAKYGWKIIAMRLLLLLLLLLWFEAVVSFSYQNGTLFLLVFHWQNVIYQSKTGRITVSKVN